MKNLLVDRWVAAETVVAELHARGYEGFLVGGAVRDILLELEPKDFDVVTNATPSQVEAIDAFERASFTDPAQAFGVTRVKVGGLSIEVATYRRDIESHLGRKLTKVEFTHIEDDLERRDFTINAIALDPHNNFLVDLHGGLDDLGAKIIRFIGDPDQRINEDPLRILRAVRFRNQLGFEYDARTKYALHTAVKQGVLKDIAVDRVQQELTRMLVHPTRRNAFEDMDQLGILDAVLPEVTACKGVKQPKDEHSEGDVWNHTMLSIDALPDNPSVRLAWATLLHDIGKDSTFSAPESPDDRIRFDNHFRVGGDMAKKILARLKFSNALQEEVGWLVHYHLITDSFPDMKQSRRYHYMGHPAFHDLLELHAADMRGSFAAKPEEDRDDEIIQRLEAMWRDYKEQLSREAPSLKKTLGIDGHWLMGEYGITDGETIGQLLKQLQEEFLDGTLKTVEDARHIVERSEAK